MRPLLIASAALLAIAVPASAVDYAKLDRAIKKEPAYTSKSPQYALLVFGPEAKLRVWCVLDGEAVYLDRDGDGDLTGAGERFDSAKDIKDIELTDPDGVTKYAFTAVQNHPDKDSDRIDLMVYVSIKAPWGDYRQYANALPAPDIKAASVSHFHGPLTAGPRPLGWKPPPNLSITAGDKPGHLHLMVGTLDESAKCWVVVESLHGSQPAFPDGVRPTLDIEFAPISPNVPPVTKRYQLDKLC